VTQSSSEPDPYRTTETGASDLPATGDYATSGDLGSQGSADYPVGAGIGVTPTTSTTSTGDWPPASGTGSLSGSEQSSSTADVAKGEAASVKDTAVDAGKNVAATAKGEAANVAQEAKQQAKSLLGTVTSEVRDQGRNQQQRIATGVHSLAKELGGMAAASDESGPLTDLAQQGARKVGEIGHWLENKEPSDVLDEVKRFARRRPVLFLGLCGLAGVVVGRLARGAVAANTSLDSPDSGNGNRELTASSYPSNYESTGYTSTYPTSYPAAGTTGYAADYPAGGATTGAPYATDVSTTYEGTRTGALDDPTYDPAAQPVYDDPAGRSDVR
jgi:hypothetical protein